MGQQAYITINGRRIGSGCPCYFIAELSANHRQNFNEAIQLIDAAKEAGVDAVKLQTYTPDTITLDCNSQPFRHQKGSLWEGQTLYNLYKEAYTPWEWHPELKRHAEALGLTLFSSPFDHTAVDFLEGQNVPAYKIASFEIIDLPLIEKVAKTGKPIILSTGMATLEEIGAAVSAAYQAGAKELALLKCCSAYPAPATGMNLRTIPDMGAHFNIPIGLSDHTLGIKVPLAAVALGACIIEKHLTLNRSNPSADAAFSLQPEEFGTMIKSIRELEQTLGEPTYGPSPEESESYKFRRSLFAVQDIEEGATLTEENVRSIRPGLGLPPKELSNVVGRTAKRFIPKGTPLKWKDLA